MLRRRMRKVVVRRPGGYERLELVTAPDPDPGPGEVLIAVRAIGVNFADCIVRMGLYESAKKYVGWPITPGFEVSGEVASVGAGVTDVTVGARVIAVTRFGGYATHVTVPRDQVRAVPPRLTLEQAAAFPVATLTAYYALLELGGAQAGSTVLVHSAGGGVGSALVQLGKIAGCKVVGVVGGANKVEVVRALGADHVIDKRAGKLWDAARSHAPRGYDIVLDANGVETLRQSYEHLATPGRLVIYGFHTMIPRGRGRPNWPQLAWNYVRTPRFNPLDLVNRNRSVLGFNLSYLFDQKASFLAALEKLSGWIEEGKLAAPPVTCFAFDDVASAHRAIQSGATVGKLALTV
jgi:NADPH:quinone reductase-like Zn-dependent oxidoreductase